MKQLFTTLLLFNLVNGYAQSIQELDPLTVTSTRTAQKVSETGRSITVIDSKQISQWPVNSVDELLRYAAGVEIQQRGPAGAQADIVIRGGTFQQVLVLMDGIKFNDPLTGHFSGYMPIVTSQIERIEILKGPAAAAYGSEAVGGVINIISKTFAGTKKEKPTSVSATVAAGEYNYFAANAALQHSTDKISYSIGAQTANSSGQLLRGNNRGYFYNHTYSGNISLQLPGKWRLMLHSSYDSRDFAAQNFYTSFVSDTAVEKVNTWWNHARLQKTKGSVTDEFDLAYKRTSDYYEYNPVSIANNNKSGMVILQYVHSRKMNSRFSYNYGSAAEYKFIRSNDRGNHSNPTAAVFGSMLYKLDKLSINPGVRIVYDDNYGTQLLPQANVAYKLHHWVFRANAGRAIRSADFTERYNNYNKPIVNGGSIGNPDLNAERSWSVEGGVDLLLKHIKLSASVYQRWQKDMIDYTPTPYAAMPRKINLNPAGNFALAKNISEVNTRGIELAIQYARNFSKSQELQISASANFLKSGTSSVVPSFYILSHAKTLLQQAVRYKFKNVGLSITSIYKERAPREASAIKATISRSYWLFNTQLNYKYRQFNAFVAVNNMGNTSYSDLLGSRMPARWTSVGITADL